MEAIGISTDLNAAEQDFQTEVRALLQQSCDFDDVRAVERTELGYSATLWQDFVSRGWSDAGGPSAQLSPVGTALLHYELGRAACPSPHIWASCTALSLLSGADNAALSQVAMSIRTGAALATVAMTESSSRPFLDGWTTRLSGSTAQRLNGTKTMVPYAHVASRLLVVATHESDPDQVIVCVVDPDASGLEKIPTPVMSREPTFTLRFHAVEVDPGTCLSISRADFVQRLFVASVARSAASAGATGRLVELSRDYAAGREAFGTRIGRFQVIQHYLADMATDAAACTTLAYRAAWAVEHGSSDALRLVSSARIVTGERFRVAAETATQVHGGYGFLEESPVPLYLRRAKAWQLSFGGTDFWSGQLATTLGL